MRCLHSRTRDSSRADDAGRESHQHGPPGFGQAISSPYEHVPRVVSVLADVLPTSTLSTKLRLVDPEVAAKMKAFLVQMQASLPQDKLAAAWGVLTPEKQAALQAVLQG